MAEPADLSLFWGRFHIVLLHLPIGFVILAAVLEGLARLPWFPGARSATHYILALTVPVAIATAACGWLLAEGGGFDPELLWWHRWLGTAAAASCVITALLHLRHDPRPYVFFLWVTVVLLLTASHFGGSLTHGKDFLTEHAPESVRKILNRNMLRSPIETRRTTVFTRNIQPILNRTCVSCHGPEKAKGKLRVDSLEALLKGGEAGPIVIPGKAAESELLKRIFLPLSHDDHMPPEGKPQPTTDEVALLKWWIDAGAPDDKTTGQPVPPPEIQHLLRATGGSNNAPTQ